MEEPDVDEEASHTVRVTTGNLLGGVVPGVLVAGCASLDVECATPLAGGVSDEAGELALSFEEGFQGVIELQAEGFVPTRVYLPGPVLVDGPFRIDLLPVTAFQGLADTGGVSLRPEMGHVMLLVFDCEYRPAAGVRFENDTGGLGFYWAGEIPTSRTQATDAVGWGGFVNVPPGMVRVDTVIDATDEVFAERLVVVRGGWLNALYLAPDSVPVDASIRDRDVEGRL